MCPSRSHVSGVPNLWPSTVDEAAEQYEIVGILFKRASAKSIPAADLKTYRPEKRAAKAATDS